ncbi:MAG: GH3 auxin-responsive promoter family protein, partial [Gallionellaceae bacterium]|nr:GH3 auxin-responsive promoter family protein [Gallionellaceae bacterium]
MRPSDLLANAAFAIAMATRGRHAYRRLLSQARDPQAAQTNALRAILAANTHTEQGKRFDLSRINNANDYRSAVPIQDYADLSAQITRQIEGESNVLSPEKPLMYARTSGTTGTAKYIPVTPSVFAQAREAQRAMAYVTHRALNAFRGKIVGLVGSGSEEILADGTPAGAMTGMIYASMPRFMRAKYIVPPDVFSIPDYEEKYRAIARYAVCESDVSAIATANPSTLLRLLDVIHAHLPDLAKYATPARRKTLEALAERGEITLADLWPRLRTVITWLGGGCAIAAATVRAQLPSGAMMTDGGYVASEVRGTIVMDLERNLALPMLGDVFFEFVPASDWEAGGRDTLLLHELELDADYHVIVSTCAGLLRYHMNDVLRVTGRIGNTPTLQFMRKGRGVTNITGEKLSEDQIHAALAALPAPPLFYIVLADARRAVYRAHIEASGDPVELAAAIDAHLRRNNLEYEAKRASGRLKPLEVVLLRAGTGEAYHRHIVEKKRQREAQVKVLALQNADECDFDF